MAMSNKEIIKHLPDWIAEKKTSFFFGSGTSAPGMPLMNDYDPKDLLEEVVQRNKALIAHDPALFIEWVESKDSRWNSPLKKEYNHFCGQSSIQAVQDFVETKFHEIQSTANEYKCFMNNILSILNNVNSRELHKNINIFSTNYDLFVEEAIDEIYREGGSVPFVFNDGARGYFKRLLDSSNFDTMTAYRGRFDNYINELPAINLIKIHGSVNWNELSADAIQIQNNVVEDIDVSGKGMVAPNGQEPENTTLKKHYYEMLRYFEYEMSASWENGSILIVHGFSFGDGHIAKALKRALENRALMVVVVAYRDADVETIRKNLTNCGLRNNLYFLSPKDFIFSSEDFNRLNLSNLNKTITGELNCA